VKGKGCDTALDFQMSANQVLEEKITYFPTDLWETLCFWLLFLNWKWSFYVMLKNTGILNMTV